MTTTQTDHKAQGIRLKNRRKALNLSANDLALELQALGQKVSRGAIANWECGKNGIVASKLPALAKVLQCSESYLLTGEGDLLDLMGANNADTIAQTKPKNVDVQADSQNDLQQDGTQDNLQNNQQEQSSSKLPANLQNELANQPDNLQAHWQNVQENESEVRLSKTEVGNKKTAPQSKADKSVKKTHNRLLSATLADLSSALADMSDKTKSPSEKMDRVGNAVFTDFLNNAKDSDNRTHYKQNNPPSDNKGGQSQYNTELYSADIHQDNLELDLNQENLNQENLNKVDLSEINLSQDLNQDINQNYQLAQSNAVIITKNLTQKTVIQNQEIVKCSIQQDKLLNDHLAETTQSSDKRQVEIQTVVLEQTVVEQSIQVDGLNNAIDNSANDDINDDGVNKELAKTDKISHLDTTASTTANLPVKTTQHQNAVDLKAQALKAQILEIFSGDNLLMGDKVLTKGVQLTATDLTANKTRPPILTLDDLRADAPMVSPKLTLSPTQPLPILSSKKDDDNIFDEFLIHHILQSSDVTMTTKPALKKSQKLANVCYDIRGPLLQMANQMESEGQQILKLNIGNPAPFGLFAPDEIIQDVAMNLNNAQGYSDSHGIFSARKAILQYYQSKGLLSATDVNDVYIGNGVSELIVLALQALLDDGDEVLIPMPDYPLWTAATNLAGGKAVHYRCDEDNDWQPNLADMASKITNKTKAIVVINPNNPTGALYSDQTLADIANLASQHNLVLMADEIYDRILYDGAVHTPMCTIAQDCLVLSFNGLSKSHRIAGFRSGWLMVSGKKDHAHDFIEGLTMLASMRLCANVPAQYAIQTAMGGYQSMQALTSETGRLNKQRMMAYNRLNAIKGVSCTLPKGAFYCFVKLDLSIYPIENDMEFMMDLLKEEKVLMVQGTGFNWDKPDHFRVVFLPNVLDLEEAMDRLERFFAKKRLQFGTQ